MRRVSRPVWTQLSFGVAVRSQKLPRETLPNAVTRETRYGLRRSSVNDKPAGDHGLFHSNCAIPIALFKLRLPQQRGVVLLLAAFDNGLANRIGLFTRQRRICRTQSHRQQQPLLRLPVLGFITKNLAERDVFK